MLSYLKEEIGKIEEALKAEKLSTHPFINQVSEYLLFAGGKRVRPLLMVLSAKLFSPDTFDERLYRTSLLFEYLHTATLLHDDVVDEAKFRRGRKAARNLWGNQATILVGDYLYAKALKIASELKNPEVMEVITETTLLMSEGEVMQLLNLDNQELSEKEYEEVIYRKTAVLISAACEVGAIIGRASGKQRECLKNYGFYLGMAFQVVDDLLDYLSTETGKDLGKDFAEGKITLPVIYALETAPSERKEELKRLLKKENPSREDFEIAFEIIQKTKGFERAKKKAEEYVRAAKEELFDLPQSTSKEALLFLTDYLLERKK